MTAGAYVSRHYDSLLVKVCVVGVVICVDCKVCVDCMVCKIMLMLRVYVGCVSEYAGVVACVLKLMKSSNTLA